MIGAVHDFLSKERKHFYEAYKAFRRENRGASPGIRSRRLLYFSWAHRAEKGSRRNSSRVKTSRSPFWARSLMRHCAAADKYVPSPEQRMDLYRRIAAVRSEEEADELVDELIDRYGEPSRPVNNLLSVALLRMAILKPEPNSANSRMASSRLEAASLSTFPFR